MLPRTIGRFRFAHRLAALGATAMLVLPAVAATVSPTPVRGATYTVEIGDGFFSPASLSVAVGDTVTWTNVDDSPHTVTSAAFDSGNLDAGQSFSFTFTEAGTFDYVCNYHDEMTASITVAEVVAAAPAAATPAASTAAAPAAPSASHEGGHTGSQPDTALLEPASGTLPAWVAPLLIGLGLVAFAFGVVPQRTRG